MSETLEILPELRDLIPPLKDYELEQLHRSLDAEGCARDELTVWKQRNVIVDGHNRYAYCKEKGYDFNVRRRSFQSIEQAKRFIILNQLGRRNVDDKTVALLRGQLQISEKKDPADTRKKGEESPQCHSDTAGDTADRIAKMTGVSRRTVLRDAKLAAAAEELGITADIVAGKCKLTRKEIVAAAEAKKNGGEANPSPVTIRQRKPPKASAPFKTPFNTRFKEAWDQFKSSFWGDEFDQAINLILKEYGQ